MKAVPFVNGTSRDDLYGGLSVLFDRNADAGMHTPAGWTLYSQAASKPRQRNVAVANWCDAQSHGTEYSGDNFSPAFVYGGLLYGHPRASAQQWASLDTAGSFTAKPSFKDPDGSGQEFRHAFVVGTRTVWVQRNYAGANQGLRLFVSDSGYADTDLGGGYGALHNVALSVGSVLATPTEVTGGAQVALWGWLYIAATDTLLFVIYAAGNTVGSCDAVWRIPNFLAGGVGALTATRVFQHAVKESGSADDGNQHIHAIAYQSATGKIVIDLGDGYGGTADANGRQKGQRTLVSTDDGVTWNNVTGTATDHSPGGQVTTYDDAYRDPTRIFVGGDASMDAGWQQVVSPYRTGSAMREMIGWDWGGGAWPGHANAAVLPAMLTLMVQGVRVLIVPNSPSAPTGSFAVYLIDPVTGDRVLYAMHTAGGLDRYAGIFNGRMQFSVYEGGVRTRWSIATPRLRYVSGTLIGARQTNLLDDTRLGAGNGAKIAKCNDFTAFTRSSTSGATGITASNDTSAVYIAGETQSVRVVQQAAVPTGATRNSPQGLYFAAANLTAGAKYVFRVALRVRKGKAVFVSIDESGGASMSGSAFQRLSPLYDSESWQQFQTFPFTMTGTTAYLRVYVQPDEVTGELYFNLGAMGLFQCSGTAPYASAGNSREWVYGTGGSERLYCTLTAAPAVFAHVFAVRCENHPIETSGDLYVVAKLAGGERKLVWFDPATSKWKLSAEASSSLGGVTGSAVDLSNGSEAIPRPGRVLVFVITSRNEYVSGVLTTRLSGRVFALDESSNYRYAPYATLDQSVATSAAVTMTHGSGTNASNKNAPLPGMILTGAVFCDFAPGDSDVAAWLESGDVAAWGTSVERRNFAASLGVGL